MKKTSSKRRNVSGKQITASRLARVKASGEMPPHYDFDYSKSRPNRFADRFSNDIVTVVLDPDVADVFDSSESVNAFLRSAIMAMPRVEFRKKKRTA